MSCHDQSCGSHDSKGCGCSCHSCKCCGSKEGQNDCCEHAKRLLHIADEAWLEALKEKIKQNILASDHQIDEIAKIIGETNRDLWQQKMAEAKAKEQYKNRLKDVMGKINCCEPKKK